MNNSTPSDEPAGLAFAVLAYGLWGIVPIYWRLLDGVPPVEVTAHRIVWCALFVMIVALARGRWSKLVAIARTPKVLGMLALTGALISANWTVYIYCVASRQLVESSLGYYINPLLSIALGFLFLHERMSRVRLAALAFAGAAVLAKAVSLGHFPWIALVLAFSFGFYGYFRKLAPVDALDGLLVETWIVLPAATAFLVFWRLDGSGAFPSPNITTDALLIGVGPVTAVPLAMFAAGARRIRLSTLGFLQYLSPSITLALAVFGYHESFSRLDAVAFGCVWIALLLVAAEGRRPFRRPVRLTAT